MAHVTKSGTVTRPPIWWPRAGLLLAIAAVLIGGCAGGSDERESSEGGTSDKAPSTTEPAPEPTEDAMLALGDEADLSIAKVTVFKYEKNIPDDGSPPGEGLRLDGALLRVCNVSFDEDGDLGELTNPFNFHVIDSDDGSYELYDLTPSPAPKPQFDGFRIVKPGQCHKGWQAFEVADDAKLVRVTYGADNDEAAAWSLN